MSISKRIMFGNDPADDAARAAMQSNASRVIDEFPCKIPTRRKNRLGPSPKWDPIWPDSIPAAAKELGIKIIHVNSQVCTRTRDEAERITAKAELMWDKRHKDFADKMSRRKI